MSVVEDWLSLGLLRCCFSCCLPLSGLVEFAGSEPRVSGLGGNEELTLAFPIASSEGDLVWDCTGLLASDEIEDAGIG